MQRTDTLWGILLDYTNRLTYLRTTAFEYFIKINGNNNKVFYKYKDMQFKMHDTAHIPLQTLVTTEELSKLEEYMEMYYEVDKQRDRLKWYITRVLNKAFGYATAIQCIPKHLHKYISLIYFPGESNVDELYIEEYYKLLEEAPLNNVLLGIQ